MGAFSFKSSGVTRADSVANALAKTAVPIGIVTPLSLGTTELLKTSTDLSTQVGDNLRNLLLTNHGERVCLYDFGGNLRPLLSELVSLDDFDSQAFDRIRSAVSRWMPYVELEDFLSEVDQSTTGPLAAIDVTITYNIPSLNVSSKRIRVKLRAM